MQSKGAVMSLILMAAPALGWQMVDDATKLANPAQRTIPQDHTQKNLVPEKTPSGMTVYREAPAKPPPKAQGAAPAKQEPAPMTPEEMKQFKEAEDRGRQRAIAEGRQSAIVPGAGEAAISEAGFGKDWPFTAPSGVLRCKRLGELHLVTFSVGNVTYAVNGTARGRLKEYGFRDSDEIWKREPGAPEMRVSSTIVQDGLTLCGTSVAAKPLDAPTKDQKLRDACAAVGNLAKHVANAKQKGSPRSVTSIMLAAATPQNAPDEIKSVFSDIVDFVYKTNLTPEDAEVAIIAACHLKLGLP